MDVRFKTEIVPVLPRLGVKKAKDFTLDG